MTCLVLNLNKLYYSPSQAVAISERGPEGCNMSLPFVLRNDPRVSQRVPELALLRGQAVDEEVYGLDGQQR